MPLPLKRKFPGDVVAGGDQVTKVNKETDGSVKWEVCIFCQKIYKKRNKTVVRVTTLQARLNIEKIAEILAERGDPVLLERICGENLLDRHACYHAQCRVEAGNIVDRRPVDTSEVNLSGSHAHLWAKAFDRLVNTIEDDLLHKQRWFTISELLDTYKLFMSSESDVDVHEYPAQNLKKRLAKHYGDQITIYNRHKRSAIVFASNITIGEAMTMVEEIESKEDISECNDSVYNDEDPARQIAHVALTLRRDIMDQSEFIGMKINNDAIQKSVPASVKLFLSFLDGGQQVIDQYSYDQEAKFRPNQKMKMLSIGQDLVYSISGKKTPKHIGLAMTLHQKTRSKTLIELFAKAGHIIPYPDVRAIDTALARHTLDTMDTSSGGVVPQNFVPGIPCHFAVDNFDLADESLTGLDQFHATNMSVYQRSTGQESCLKDIRIDTTEKCLQVPDALLDLPIPPTIAPNLEPPYPLVTATSGGDNSRPLEEAMAKDALFVLSRQSEAPRPSWTGFNEQVSSTNPAMTNVGYLPMINAPANEYRTLHTVINRCMYTAESLGNKYCIITVDQGLFPKMMELKWTVPEYKEKLIVKLGGFHIKLNFLGVLGKHMRGTGLSAIWIEGQLFAPGTTEKVMNGSDFNKAMRGHKLTFQALWRCLLPQMTESFSANHPTLLNELLNVDHADTDGLMAITDSEQFRAVTANFAEGRSTDKTFCLWWNYMKMVQLLLAFTRAERDGNWELYMSAFKKMLPYFFRYDHYNYARWGTIFVAEMANLPEEVHRMFLDGDFVVKRSNRRFNQVDADHSQEWLNGSGKANGGIVGIQKSPQALARWALSFHLRSEIASDTISVLGAVNRTFIHVEETPARVSKDNVAEERLVSLMQRFGVFPSVLGRSELMNVVTRDIAPVDICESILNVHRLGTDLFTHFVSRTTSNYTQPFRMAIPRQNAKTLHNMYAVANKKNGDNRKATVKTDRDVSRRLIACYASGRPVDLAEIARHELTSVPISIFDADGRMRTGNKALLVDALLDGVDCRDTLEPVAGTSTLIIDGQALVVSMAPVPGMRTFDDLATAFERRLVFLSNGHDRIDVVFDNYDKRSVKSTTRTRRSANCQPVRRSVTNGEVPLPVSWGNFLAVADNKADYAEFLSNRIINSSLLSHKQITTSGGYKDILLAESNSPEVTPLSCDHEEADTRIVYHASNIRSNRIVVKARDTDILVLLLAHCDDIHCDQLWLDAGIAKKPKLIPVHSLRDKLTLQERTNLLAFHAITGSDVSSFLAGTTKKSALKVYMKRPELLGALGDDEIAEEGFTKVENFVCKLYKIPEDIRTADTARQYLLPKGVKPEQMPPSSDALRLHILRANYATMVWKRATLRLQNLPSALEFGWRECDGKLMPVMTTLPPIPTGCLEMITCRCTTGCESKRCSCRQANLPCTHACHCQNHTIHCKNQG